MGSRWGPCISLERADVKAPGENDYGEVEFARLVLKGNLQPVVLEVPNEEYNGLQWSVRYPLLHGTHRATCRLDTPVLAPWHATEISCLRLGFKTTPKQSSLCLFLLLRPVNNDNRFGRTGRLDVFVGLQYVERICGLAPS